MLLAVNPTNPSRPISPNRSIEPNDEIPVNPEINQDKSQSSLAEINSEKIGNLATITLGCLRWLSRASPPNDTKRKADTSSVT